MPKTTDIVLDEGNLVAEMRKGFSEMGKELISSKLTQQTIFAQSAAEGGPDSANAAIANLMSHCNVGYRRLAQVTGVNRKVLLNMIEGRLDMPHEVYGAIVDELNRVYNAMQKKTLPLFDTEKQGA